MTTLTTLGHLLKLMLIILFEGTRVQQWPFIKKFFYRKKYAKRRSLRGFRLWHVVHEFNPPRG